MFFIEKKVFAVFLCNKYGMSLIIVSDLINPPSEGLYFRHLTMVSALDFKQDVLIESEKEYVDIYYNYLKKRGLYDFVEEFIQPEWRVDGIRIDTELNYPKTIKTNYIRYENVENLIKQIKSLSSIL
jgi:hypothetical protein